VGDRRGDLPFFTVAVIASAGVYETSGDRLYDLGLPGTSGMGGGSSGWHRAKVPHRDVRAAARRGREQREGTARDEILATNAGLDVSASKPER
jgi:glutaminase